MDADIPQHSATDTSPRTQYAPSGLLAEARDHRTLGPHGMAKMTKIVRAVRRRNDVPPPEGHAAWSDAAEADVAQDWLAEAALDGGLDVMLATVTDDASLVRYLHRCIQHHFADQARATERGARGKTLRGIVQRTDGLAVLKRPVRYAIANCALLPTYSGDPDRLHAAAGSVPIGPAAPWNGERRAPIGQRSDVTAVLRAVLTEAAAPVLEQPTIVDVIAQRFDLQLDEPSHVPFDDTRRPPGPNATDDPDDTAVQALAEALWDRLDDSARLVLGPHIDALTVREIETMTGVRRSTVNRRITVIDAEIRRLMNVRPESAAALATLKDRSYQLLGTSLDGSPSDAGVEQSS